MLYEIMRHLKNFFSTDVRKEGSFTIEDGKIGLSSFVKEGQYFLIEGSSFNDGVYTYPASDLTDEAFDGCVTVLAPPPSFLILAEEIASFVESDQRGAFQSESFGGYSYTRATNAHGGVADWQDIFRERLNIWRKL